MMGNVAILTRLQDTTAAVQQLKEVNPEVSDVTVLSVVEGSNVAQTVANSSAKESAFNAVVAFNDQTEQLNSGLNALLPLLKSGGVLQLHVDDVQEEKKNAILMALMIGGLVDTTDKQESSVFYPELSGAVVFSSKKQSFESTAIPLAKKTSALPTKKWTVLADDFGDDEQDDDIIDEDTLLDDTDEVLQLAKADCGEKVGAKKRACKNCTCGLKDEEDQPVMSEKDLNKLVSGCGNCYKGDAFRCGSCPFLGKPAFKPGMEKVLLNLDDADDI
ncbi:Anamorsin [Phytophthora citrophthora]|uniref:Anamorsin homolog n=1 Tax=Phytophthora citrophthora TaxID=4793 RepID=A0AAD9GJK8_9STRA|nr:Anamorsin [Phytophthora citrophthora]